MMLSAPLPYRLSALQSRSITPGNPSGGRGGALAERRHEISIPAGEIATVADIRGPGMIRQFWMTIDHRDPIALRSYVIRIYWDESEHPSVEAPWSDFFGVAHGRVAHYATPYMGVSEGKGFYCAFPMPFSTRCRITIHNDTDDEAEHFFYQVNYTLGDRVDSDDGRFHAHFRRDTPPRGSNFTILDVSGSPGVYVGTLLSALPNEAGTWREGEFQFYIDGDDPRPTIVGTGWSDWFLSGWGLSRHQSFYAGSNYQVPHPEMKNKYFCSCYRFHVMDPIYFSSSLRVEHTQIGRRPGMEGITNQREDDWCSVAYWYQRLTSTPLPPIPTRGERIHRIEPTEWEAEALAAMPRPT